MAVLGVATHRRGWGVVLFLVLAVVAVVASIAMVLARSSVHSALFLVLTFFCLAVLYLTLNAEFLAVIQILVYAGAIMVLFLFVITLLNPGREETEDRLGAQRPLALALGLGLLVEIVLLLSSGVVRTALGDFPAAAPFEQQLADPSRTTGQLGNTEAIGIELFTTYLLPFEITSVLLLLAVIGAVVLAKRQLR